MVHGQRSQEAQELLHSMKLHTVFITYNRLELTKRAIESWVTTVPARSRTASVVDNGSQDGTGEWLSSEWVFARRRTHLLSENRYPGFATNLGWEDADSDVTHLHRADNDFIFLPGWFEEVERKFSEDPWLGQLGLRTDEEEGFETGNTGGNCVIRRELWDEGLRWDERTWPELRDQCGKGITEDTLFTAKIVAMGWHWDRVDVPCLGWLASSDPEDDYYQQTWRDRGIYDWKWKQSVQSEP